MSSKPFGLPRWLPREPLRVEAAGATDPGAVRARNEDRFVVRGDLGLVMIADGVAGREHGDVAAELALELAGEFVDYFGSGWAEDHPRDDEPELLLLQTAVRHANARVHLAASSQTPGRGMATTFVGLLAREDRVLIAHVGDSRAYRLRRGRLERLTTDHTVGNELIARGLSREAILGLPRRDALSRALGLLPEVEVTGRAERAREGDVVLLCSDGLHGALREEVIAEIVRWSRDLEACARSLIMQANLEGAPDNVTVALARWVAA